MKASGTFAIVLATLAGKIEDQKERIVELGAEIEKSKVSSRELVDPKDPQSIKNILIDCFWPQIKRTIKDGLVPLPENTVAFVIDSIPDLRFSNGRYYFVVPIVNSHGTFSSCNFYFSLLPLIQEINCVDQENYPYFSINWNKPVPKVKIRNRKPTTPKKKATPGLVAMGLDGDGRPASDG